MAIAIFAYVNVTLNTTELYQTSVFRVANIGDVQITYPNRILFDSNSNEEVEQRLLYDLADSRILPNLRKHGWLADMGVYYFVIVSGNLDATQATLDSGAQMIIIPSEYSSEKLKGLFFFAPDGSKSSPTTINGQEAAKMELTENEQLKIELLVVRKNWALVVLATFPSENEMGYRPL